MPAPPNKGTLRWRAPLSANPRPMLPHNQYTHSTNSAPLHRNLRVKHPAVFPQRLLHRRNPSDRGHGKGCDTRLRGSESAGVGPRRGGCRRFQPPGIHFGKALAMVRGYHICNSGASVRCRNHTHRLYSCSGLMMPMCSESRPVPGRNDAPLCT